MIYLIILLHRAPQNVSRLYNFFVCINIEPYITAKLHVKCHAELQVVATEICYRLNANNVTFSKRLSREDCWLW